MARNVKQVYDDNPSVTALGTDLIYLGKSPYTGADDSAILTSDIFPTAIPPAADTVATYRDTTGTKLKATGVTIIGDDISTVDSISCVSVNVSGLTASRLVSTDASKNLVSVSNLTTFIAGTSNRITVATDGVGGVTIDIAATYVGQTSITNLGTISIGTWNATTVGADFGGTGVASPAIHTIPVAQGASAFSFKTLTNGQVLIGSTGADPVPASITAGTNISVTNGAGTITIAATGSGSLTWSEITGTSQTIAVNKGYVANNAGLVTFTLPTTAVVGDIFMIVGKGAGLFRIAQGVGQQINVGSSSSTSGAGGSVTATNQFDSIFLVCTVANTTWTTVGGPQGNFTVV